MKKVMSDNLNNNKNLLTNDGKIIYENLINEALDARRKSYCKYSGFAVGAALLTNDGKLFKGCNIENAAFGPSICAERVAIFKALSSDEIFDKNFRAIAVVGGKKDDENLDYCAPCGVCRQVMQEFCKENFEIILSKTNEDKIIDYKIYTLKEILPLAFNNLN